MITESDVLLAGRISRTHGKEGTLLFAPSADWAYGIGGLGLEFFFVEREGCYVPFRIEEVRESGGKCYLKLSGVETIDEAEEFVGESVYAEREAIGETEEYADYSGYEIFDQENRYIGTIDYVDDSTENVLFYLEDEDGEGEVIIPAADEWIIETDDEARVIRMEIPEGLAEVNKTRGVYDEDEDEEEEEDDDDGMQTGERRQERNKEKKIN